LRVGAQDLRELPVQVVAVLGLEGAQARRGR
jgi:hypothetical protein